MQFKSGACVFCGESRGEIFAALSVATGNRLIGLQAAPYCFMRGSRIYAEIECDGRTYETEAVYDDDVVGHCGVRAFCDGRRLGEAERQAAFAVSEEEEECSFFVNPYDYRRYVPFARLDYTEKLSDYRKALGKEGATEFAARTGGVGVTPIFRRELENFCAGFSPRILNTRKELRQVMDGDGKFRVDAEHGRAGFGESDAVLLDYFSFLEVNRFWGRVRETAGGGKAKPLFVVSLLDRVETFADLSPAMRETRALGRQTFVFTSSQSRAAALAREDGWQTEEV